MFDLLIKGGVVVDGTGNPWFKSDVGVVGKKIVAIGKNLPSNASRILDARRKIVSPGFIDVHTHSDYPILVNPKAESMIRQGVTFNLIGHCGMSAAPLSEVAKKESASRYSKLGLKLDWHSMAEYLGRVEDQGSSINIAALVGHSAVRMEVIGLEKRPPTGDELDEMKRVLEASMREGAFGFSTGLIYPPSMYAETEEIVALAEVAAQFNGVYYTHPRGEGETIEKATAEAIEIGEKAGIPVQLAHHTPGAPFWGKQKATVKMIEEARARGVDVSFDVIPYADAHVVELEQISKVNYQGGDILPSWALSGGREKVLERLKDPETREKIKDEILSEDYEPVGRSRTLVKYKIWDRITLGNADKPHNKPLIGKTLDEISKIRNAHPVDLWFDLIVEEPNLSFVKGFFCEEDVRYVLSHPLSMVCSDSSATSVDRPLGEKGLMSPRTFGTFPRILSRYVRETKLIPLEEAVRKMTSAPAMRIGVKERGFLLENYFADINVFDLGKICETATLTKQSYPEGIEYVIVNGEVVLENGKHREMLSGAILRNPEIP